MIVQFHWRDDLRNPRRITSSGKMFIEEYMFMVKTGHPSIRTGKVSLVNNAQATQAKAA